MRLAYAFSNDLARSKIGETKVEQAMTRYNVEGVELTEIFVGEVGSSARVFGASVLP